MCGIVGYLGTENATERILEGLGELEYRGYDSAGISLITEEGLCTVKREGRLERLATALRETPLRGKAGIGHTRWATHGAPSDQNSHPHLSPNGNFSVVHNGIIENYHELRENLKAKGHVFLSDTDTEVIPHLLEEAYRGDFKEAVERVLAQLEGAYALAILCASHPGEMIAARKESPLILGLSDDGLYVASDVPAILSHTRKVILLENGDLVHVKGKAYEITAEGRAVKREITTIEWSKEEAGKGGYDHFMAKEIHEQPEVLQKTLRHFEKDREFLSILKELGEKRPKITITACGTAFHAGLLGAYFLESLLKRPIHTRIASELRYRTNLMDEESLLIVISQSGETADSLQAMKLAAEKGAKTLAITNVVGSSIARAADYVFLTKAGPEIAVASTKAYTTQVLSLLLIAMTWAEAEGTDCGDLRRGLETLPEKVKEALSVEPLVKEISQEILSAESAFFMGRGFDYESALEASLKLKEISYIHAEALPAGELKHGTIALIEKNVPVISLLGHGLLAEKLRSNVKEVKARGAKTITIAPREWMHQEDCDFLLPVPVLPALLMPLVTIVPCQLLAYHVTLLRNLDVDKPRNLAKSVTVE